MEFPSRGIHVARQPGIVEGKQLQTKLARVFRLNPSFRSGTEEFLHAPMAEALDHSYSVTLHVTESQTEEVNVTPIN